MYTVILSEQAEEDLVRMYRFIAESGFPENGAGFVRKIWNFCQSLQQFPMRGTSRPDVAEDLRTLSFNKQVTIVFEVLQTRKLVNVARIVERRRDLEQALQHVR